LNLPLQYFRIGDDNAPKRVLLIGLDPILVNFQPERGRNAEQVMGEGAQAAFDCIMIGAGLRGLVENIILFERAMNVIHQDAPLAKLCFNTQPSDTVGAVLRWV
jgi:hypothetical protein